jgi:L-ribulose-5-phosphate 3-epimerase
VSFSDDPPIQAIVLVRSVCYHLQTFAWVAVSPLPSHRGSPAVKKSIMRATLPAKPSIVKNLDAVKKAGFDGIQLGILPPNLGELSFRSTDDQVKELRKACLDAGVEPHSIYGGVSFFNADAAERKQSLEDGKRVIDVAAGLGAKTWLIHPGQLSTDVPYDDAWKFSIEGLNALKTRAEQTHLRIGLENVWNKFLMSPLEALRVVQEVNSAMVGIWFDIGNCAPFAFPEQWVRILGKNIVGIHMKDFKRAGNIFGTGDNFVPLFHGSVNWPVVMRQLAAAGFDDYLVSEVSLGSQPLPEALHELSRQLDVMIALAKTPKP